MPKHNTLKAASTLALGLSSLSFAKSQSENCLTNTASCFAMQAAAISGLVLISLSLVHAFKPSKQEQSTQQRSDTERTFLG